MSRRVCTTARTMHVGTARSGLTHGAAWEEHHVVHGAVDVIGHVFGLRPGKDIEPYVSPDRKTSRSIESSCTAENARANIEILTSTLLQQYHSS
jgi:hypothetical protein